MGSELLAFSAFAAIAVFGSLFVIAQRNPITARWALVAAFFGLSGLYVLLEAPFVAIVQIIIYAGAIMVLFLFVVMLLNVPREDAAEWDRTHPLYRPWPMRIGAVLALALIAQLGWAVWNTPGVREAIGGQSAAASDVAQLGRVLFTDYMFAFEVTSILILGVDGRRCHPGAKAERMNFGTIPLNYYLITVRCALHDRNGWRVFPPESHHPAALGRDHAERGQPRVRRVRPAVRHRRWTDHVFFVMTVAAAEAAVGLALVIALFRHRESLNPEAFTSLKW